MRSRLSMDKLQLFAYFIGLSLIGAFALSLSGMYENGHSAQFIDALFTSVSAVCVTGLSTLPMNVYSPAGFITIMILIEFGGLGIVTFFSLYIAVPQRKVSLVNRAVIKDFFIDEVETEPRKIVYSIIVFTLVIEIICAIPLYLGFRFSGSESPLLDAVFHAVSAFCNAGFSTYDDSLATFITNDFVLVPIFLLFIIGGIGFIVLTDVIRKVSGKRTKLSFHSRLVLSLTVTLLFIGGMVYLIIERNRAFSDVSLGRGAFLAVFQAATPRTAGFTVLSQGVFSPFIRLFTVILMFIGGSPGSIAGGVKTTTFFLVILYAIRGNPDLRGLNVGQRNLDTTLIERAFSIVAKSLMVVIVIIAALLVSERLALESGTIQIFDLVFETVSAFSTVGLSLDVTPSLSTTGKILIILAMFFGRTGMFAMALGFAKTEKERFVEYPSARVMIG